MPPDRRSAIRSFFSTPFLIFTLLIVTIPIADPDHETQAVRLEGTLPSPREVVRGCPFQTRCPRKVGPICEEEEPPWRDAGQEHYIYCHIPLDELVEMQSGGTAAYQEGGAA